MGKVWLVCPNCTTGHLNIVTHVIKALAANGTGHARSVPQTTWECQSCGYREDHTMVANVASDTGTTFKFETNYDNTQPAP